MAKRLAYNYTFTPSTNTIVVDGSCSTRNLLLITNVTDGIIIYNFADPSLGATSVTYSGTTNKTTIVLEYNCSAMSSTDDLQIFIDMGGQEVEPVEQLYDPVNKMRVSTPQALIDTDFEYGTQITKWENLLQVNNRPGAFFSPISIGNVSSMTITPNQNVVTVNLSSAVPRPGIGTFITVQDSILPFCNGNFVVDTTPSATQFTYKTRVVNTTPITSIFDSSKTGIYSGTTYSNAGFGTAVIGVQTSVGYAVTVTTPHAHGLYVGNQIVVIGSGSTIINGAYSVASIGSTNTFTYYVPTIPTAGISTSSTQLFVRPSGTIVHRAGDGGVIFSSNTASNFESTLRQTRRYFRYQSGKGIQVSSGTVLKPGLVLDSLTSSGTTVTVVTKEPHNIQRIVPGTTINVVGCNESAYNGTFTVTNILGPNRFTYTALTTPSDTIASGAPLISITGWYGSTNRLGIFDQQNGMFFQFDGQTLYAVRRSSTLQLPGRVSVVTGSVTVTQSSTEFPTYFAKYLRAGDWIVIRGQSYRVTEVDSNTSLTITPAYRGPSADHVTCYETIDTKIPQSDWNLDKCDGTGPSGYNLDLTRMQMFYIDYSWYGAGFIRWGFRGPGGNVFYAHKMQNNNLNTEAYMRSGNLPARYETSTEPPYTTLASSLGAGDTAVGIASTAGFPPRGTVVVRNGNTIEYMNYVGVGTTALFGLVRGRTGERNGIAVTASIGSAIISVNAGAGATNNLQVGQRVIHFGIPEGTAVADIGIGGSISLTGAATTNLSGVAVTFAPMGATSAQSFPFSTTDPTAVELAFPTYAPTISHWGTSVIMDGRFDDDKSLVFTYGQQTGISVPASSSRALFSIRISPSVDNGVIGGFGAREIQNRLQLTLRALDLTSQTANANLLVRAYLNAVPSTSTAWTNAVSNALGAINSSLAQIADYPAGSTTVANGEVIAGFFVGTGANSIDLSQLRDLGNCIQGGGGTNSNTNIYPDGPDTLTIVVTNLSTTTAATVFGRLSWTEAQA
jgi:hypothetical protein